MVDPWSGDLLVVSKEQGSSGVYRAAAETLLPGRVIPLTEIGRVQLDQPSAGDISPDGREILLRNEDRAIVLLRGVGQSLADALLGNMYDVPVVGRPEEPNGEAIAFGPQGGAYFTISEGLNPLLYRFERIAPAAGDANLDQVFDSSDLVQVFQFGKYQSDRPALWAEGDWNGDGWFDSSDLVLAFAGGAYTTESRGAAAPTQSLLAAAVDAVWQSGHETANRRG
jgi:hypothetical protein